MAAAAATAIPLIIDVLKQIVPIVNGAFGDAKKKKVEILTSEIDTFCATYEVSASDVKKLKAIAEEMKKDWFWHDKHVVEFQHIASYYVQQHVGVLANIIGLLQSLHGIYQTCTSDYMFARVDLNIPSRADKYEQDFKRLRDAIDNAVGNLRVNDCKDPKKANAIQADLHQQVNTFSKTHKQLEDDLHHAIAAFIADRVKALAEQEAAKKKATEDLQKLAADNAALVQQIEQLKKAAAGGR